jgi:hypothetical protein
MLPKKLALWASAAVLFTAAVCCVVSSAEARPYTCYPCSVATDPPATTAAASDCTKRVFPDRPVLCPWNCPCRPPKEQVNVTIQEAAPAQTVQPSPPAIAVDPPPPKFPFALLGIVVAVSLLLSGIAAFYARVRSAGPSN